MRFFWLWMFILLSHFSNAQMSLSGNVIDASTRKPLDGASVFLGNTSIGSTTNANGDFTLSRISPGQYDLIVTIIGYETYVQPISSQQINGKISIRLQPKTMMMPVVSIMSKAERQRLLKLFIRDFVGTESEASQCKIKNLDDIFLEFDRKQNQLSASTEDFLVIENKPLGYRLKFLIKQFNSNYSSHLIYYEGQALFEEMKGNASAIRRWHKNRRTTYFGSPMHFLRSLIRANGQGFVLRKLVREPNPLRPPDSLIREKLKKYAFNPDSLKYWNEKMRMPLYNQTLYNDMLASNTVAARTDMKNVYALRFSDLLYVTYPAKKRLSNYSVNITEQPLNGDTGASIIKLNLPYALFDPNGVILNPRAVVYEGLWSEEKISHLLPNNYEPE